MNHTRSFAAAFAVLLALPAAAETTGEGELGLALARGNARSDSLNGKVSARSEDARWTHEYSLTALRARGEVRGDFDGDGAQEERFELNANRYEGAASSALKLDERNSWVAALRHERDDFAPASHQSTFSLGYGHRFGGEGRSLEAQVGPGFRHARAAASGQVERDGIVRGELDYKQRLTASTEVYNKLLLESGDTNTFAQNDVGVQVAMNASLALKAGIQLRHNTQAGGEAEKTDSLTSLNLVYRIK
jgi:putative salt-induced outer membrane protein